MKSMNKKEEPTKELKIESQKETESKPKEPLKEIE
jgi:hypothetical protein